MDSANRKTRVVVFAMMRVGREEANSKRSQGKREWDASWPFSWYIKHFYPFSCSSTAQCSSSVPGRGWTGGGGRGTLAQVDPLFFCGLEEFLVFFFLPPFPPESNDTLIQSCCVSEETEHVKWKDEFMVSKHQKSAHQKW